MTSRLLLKLWALFLALAWPAAAREPSLRVGADRQGGAPYIFVPPGADEKLVKGFEWELVNAVATRLGRPVELVQNEWDSLIPGLLKGDYDVAITGIEITPERKEVVAFSDPYLVTHLTLAVRDNEARIQRWADCVGKRVGALKQSQAAAAIEQQGKIELVTYGTEVDGYTDLLLGRIDAMLCDAPVARYYGAPRVGLRLLQEPIGRMEYGFAVAKTNPDLRERINEVLRALRTSGQLREIVDRWNLWNPHLTAEWGDAGVPRGRPVEYEAFLEAVKQNAPATRGLRWYASLIPQLLRAAGVTLGISLASMLLASSLGLLLALGRVYGPRPLGWLVVGYVELLRGTPLLFQLLFLYYGLPNLGLDLSPFLAGFLGLGLNYAAAEAENFRAGLQAIPRGQLEAAHSLGFTRWHGIYEIVFPQALRTVFPPMTNDFIALLKDSSLVSVLTMVELTKTYTMLATTYFDYFGVGLLTAAIYLLMGLPFARLARFLEARLQARMSGQAA
ncbi:MAG: ABC transporter permease subunit [Verrucomicrobia bacterium]|nr:ABC transporter permease subunit [Verrucomicrobiota bacterium]